MTAREYLAILHVAERLKDTPRHCTTSQGRIESVAEHSWRVSLMAYMLRHEFPELNMDKVVDMCLIHDLGECFTGDIPTFIKTETDRETEDSLLFRWVASLPKELSEDFSALYREMDEQQSPEAKLYKALDKLEALIQHNESPLHTWSENEYELNRTYAFDTVSYSEWLTGLRKEILADTLDKIEREGTASIETEAEEWDYEAAIQRIAYYEQLMKQVEQALKCRTSAEELMSVQDQVSSLEAYYRSRDWRLDYTADEAGLLPAELKRGVLSEDGIYNLLETYHERLTAN